MVDKGGADIVWLADKNWQFTVAWGDVIYERRSNFRSEHNAEAAMEAAWQRMQKFYAGKGNDRTNR